MTDFYIYVYFRHTGEPCYIGKGRGDRWRRHTWRSCNPHLESILKIYGQLPVVKIRQGLSESDAFEIETAMIRAIGRRPHGPLVNMTDGGDGSAGRREPKTAEHRRKIAESEKGKFVSAETRAKQRARKIGKPLSDDHKAAIAKANSGVKKPWLSERMKGNQFGRRSPG